MFLAEDFCQADQVRSLLGSNIWCSYAGLQVFAFRNVQFTGIVYLLTILSLNA